MWNDWIKQTSEVFIEYVISNTQVTKKATMPWKNNRQTRRETEEILVENEPG